MLKPFERFLGMYVNEFIKLGKIYLVTQTYSRHYGHINEKQKIGILISDYSDFGLAKGHYSALKNAKDKYAYILDITNEKHLAKLNEMIAYNADYAVYWAAVDNIKKLTRQLNTNFTGHIKRYLLKNTRWAIDRDTTIKPKLKVIFGELFVTISFRGEELRVKFEDIENS